MAPPSRPCPPSSSTNQGLDPAEVCTLPPADRQDRLAWVRQEILPRALEINRLEKGLVFELAVVPGLIENVDRLIELERGCCSGITWQRAAGSTSDRVRLEVLGVDPDSEIFRSLDIPTTAPSR